MRLGLITGTRFLVNFGCWSYSTVSLAHRNSPNTANDLKRFCPDIYHAQRLFTLNDKLKTTNGKRPSPPHMLIT